MTGAQFKQHLKDARLILKKPQAQYITVALEEYLLEVVSPICFH